MLTSGGGPLLLTKDEGNKAVRGFSFDGAEIYFARTLGEYEIWSIPLSAALPNISPPANSSPIPDGQFLYVEKNDSRIVRIAKGASAEEPITTLPSVSTLSMYPDGQHYSSVRYGMASRRCNAWIYRARNWKLSPIYPAAYLRSSPGQFQVILFISAAKLMASSIFGNILSKITGFGRSHPAPARTAAPWPIPMAREFISSTGRVRGRSRSIVSLPSSSLTSST